MNSKNRQSNFQHDAQGRIGILITNLGTPDAPTSGALRRYLKEFLWDPRIVDLPRWLWWCMLQVILIIRPSKSAHAYNEIWDSEKGSPLLHISNAQLDSLRSALSENLTVPHVVELGMRYGNPSIGSALEKLREANVQKLLVLPLYPQYSSSTTASTFDAIAQAVKSWRWVPEMRFINQYHDDPGYIEALVASVEETWQVREQPQKLIFSFHGTPKRFLLEGDPYYCQCSKTARLVAGKLKLDDSQWQLCFQSIFGREEWLKPYTIDTLQEMPKQNITNVNVICPGFSADCLETLEEIEMQNRQAFMDAGGEEYHYIPALNDREDHIKALVAIILRHSEGWLYDLSTYNEESATEIRSTLALAAGSPK